MTKGIPSKKKKKGEVSLFAMILRHVAVWNCSYRVYGFRKETFCTVSELFRNETLESQRPIWSIFSLNGNRCNSPVTILLILRNSAWRGHTDGIVQACLPCRDCC